MATLNLRIASIAAISAAVGVFFGNWAWSEYSESRIASARARALETEAKERASPKGRQREAVRRKLNDPGSAEFRNEVNSGKVTNQWCGEVNAKNQMGAFVGFTRYIAELQEDSSMHAKDRADLDPQGESGSAAMREQFDKYYVENCVAAPTTAAPVAK